MGVLAVRLVRLAGSADFHLVRLLDPDLPVATARLGSRLSHLSVRNEDGKDVGEVFGRLADGVAVVALPGGEDLPEVAVLREGGIALGADLVA